MLKVVADEAAREDLTASLDEIAREGTRRMLAARAGRRGRRLHRRPRVMLMGRAEDDAAVKRRYVSPARAESAESADRRTRPHGV